jgi:hypothetical protein
MPGLLLNLASGSLKGSEREAGSTTSVTCVVAFTVPNLAFGHIRKIVILMSVLGTNTINSSFARIKWSCVTGNCECKKEAGPSTLHGFCPDIIGHFLC